MVPKKNTNETSSTAHRLWIGSLPGVTNYYIKIQLCSNLHETGKNWHFGRRVSKWSLVTRFEAGDRHNSDWWNVATYFYFAWIDRVRCACIQTWIEANLTLRAKKSIIRVDKKDRFSIVVNLVRFQYLP